MPGSLGPSASHVSRNRSARDRNSSSAREPSPALGPARLPAEQLEGDLFTRALVDGPVDLTHAAAAEHRDDPVVLEPSWGREREQLLELARQLLALAGGVWFVVGPTLSKLWTSGSALAGQAGNPAGSESRQVLELLTMFYGAGAAIIALAAFALGRLAVRSVRDVELAACQRSLSQLHEGGHLPTLGVNGSGLGKPLRVARRSPAVREQHQCQAQAEEPFGPPRAGRSPRPDSGSSRGARPGVTHR